jgi:hypothetical protein
LCDLDASVSFISKSVFDRISVGELVPTKISLQLADRSVKYPLGHIEDLPLQVGKFYIPIDFVIIEINEDPNTSLILGRSLFSTARTQIDARGGKLTFKIEKERLSLICLKQRRIPLMIVMFARLS